MSRKGGGVMRQGDEGGRRWADRLLAARPGDDEELDRFVRSGLGLEVPREAIEPGHTPPFAYLRQAFRGEGAEDGGDCIVWANRGGGKTLLGAVATLLDLVFKPGIEVRVLGGSLAQSSKMYEHLAGFFDRALFRPLVRRPPTQRRIELVNGSRVEILAQSQRAVRGLRVHKLRCDEVDLFDPDIWEAAQLVTRSGWCGDWYVPGTIEALSTMHRPGGLMARLIGDQAGVDAAETEERRGALPGKVFRWNALDVVARCPPARACERCELWADCQGRAKSASGFFPVADLVAQWHRASLDTWEAEMLCRRPRLQHSVYPNFDLTQHVQTREGGLSAGEGCFYVAGMDFGLRSPTVFRGALGAPAEREEAQGPGRAEYQQAGRTLRRHVGAIERQALNRGRPGGAALRWVGIDPAGRQRSSHTGLSDVDVLKRAGFAVRARAAPLRDGIERVRRRLDHGTLTVAPRCHGLIEALRSYHFDAERPGQERPVKDGPDHLCDALRYLVVNLELGPRPVAVRQYV
jgi:hypothetical protein